MSSVRSVVDAEQQQRAVLLAESLLASREFLDDSGWSERGRSAGFDWVIQSAPYLTAAANANLKAVPLHDVSVVVSWTEGGQPRQFALQTLKAQKPPPPGGRK